MAEIVVLGSLNMDLVGTAERFVQPGETLLGQDFLMSQGGKGGNQAIACSRAGGEVQLLAAVGDDSFGTALVAAVADVGVATDLVRRVDGPSGVALITVVASGENSILVLPGANGSLTDLTRAELAAITGASLLVCQLEVPLDTVVAAARAAHGAGVPVLLNPSPVQALPPALLEAVSIVVVNRDEADAIGSEALAAVPHVVTTLGGDGADYRGSSGVHEQVAVPTVDVVDTTGAGDAFTGALAVAWVRGTGVVAALRYACTAGALATTVSGAGVSSPSAAQINELVGQTWA